MFATRRRVPFRTALDNATHCKYAPVANQTISKVSDSLTIPTFSYPKFKKVERRTTGAPGSVYTTVPASESAVSAAIIKLFGDSTRSFARFGRLQVYPTSNNVFPDQYQLQAAAQRDTYLRAYLSLASESRANDLYLMTSDDNYWDSEYYYNGEPAKFRCSFIVHLEPAQNSGTRVEVFEYRPEIRAGRKFGVGGDKLIGFFDDLRDVAPTVADRLVLLDAVKQGVNTFCAP